mmetsp:Transcript_12420/g.38280  ORF Transcript_12420/g.38280 Transcript_12420/m.38280 type:complete len:358 (-) Transcript_12420:3785-4858(-)
MPTRVHAPVRPRLVDLVRFLPRAVLRAQGLDQRYGRVAVVCDGALGDISDRPARAELAAPAVREAEQPRRRRFEDLRLFVERHDVSESRLRVLAVAIARIHQDRAERVLVREPRGEGFGRAREREEVDEVEARRDVGHQHVLALEADAALRRSALWRLRRRRGKLRQIDDGRQRGALPRVVVRRRRHLAREERGQRTVRVRDRRGRGRRVAAPRALALGPHLHGARQTLRGGRGPVRVLGRRLAEGSRRHAGLVRRHGRLGEVRRGVHSAGKLEGQDRALASLRACRSAREARCAGQERGTASCAARLGRSTRDVAAQLAQRGRRKVDIAQPHLGPRASRTKGLHLRCSPHTGMPSC